MHAAHGRAQGLHAFPPRRAGHVRPVPAPCDPAWPGRHLLRHAAAGLHLWPGRAAVDRKSTRLNSSHQIISYAVFCLKKEKKTDHQHMTLLANDPMIVWLRSTAARLP